jgi:hypothetical protein
MANLWDTLDEDQRSALVDAHTSSNGGRTPENISRAKEQLIANPRLVERLAKETGIIGEDDEALQDESDVSQFNEVEDTINASLEDSGDVQQPGTVTKTNPTPYESDIPPPEPGEAIEGYIRRLSAGIGAWEDEQPVRNPNYENQTVNRALSNRSYSDRTGREMMTPEDQLAQEITYRRRNR